MLILAAGLLWLLWALCTPAGRIGTISGWLLLMLGIAVLATGFSPVPMAAFKGLLKLLSYLSVRPDAPAAGCSTSLVGSDRGSAARWRAGECGAGDPSAYGDTTELARWADPNSVADGTIRVYGPLENPNLLAGYLIPILPIALVALLRWRSWPQRLFAATALLSGSAASFSATAAVAG